MAYIGSNKVANYFSSARPRDEFLGDGFSHAFPLSQEVPGGFESNITPVIDNVVQEPATAYTIKSKIRLTYSNTQHFPVYTLIPYQTYYGVSPVAPRTFSEAFLYTEAAIGASATEMRQLRVDNDTVIASGDIIVSPTSNHEGAVLVNITGTFEVEPGLGPNLAVYRLQMLIGADWYDVGSDDPLSPIGEIFTTTEAHVEVKEPERSMRIEQANGAVGIVVERTSNFIDILQTSVQPFESTGGTVVYRRPYQADYDAAGVDISYQSYTMGSFDVDSTTEFRYQVIEFTGVPEADQVIYIRHDGGSTFQAAPTAGSVDEVALADNLKQFTVDKFISTQNQTDFQLSKTPASINAIQVFVNGSLKTDTIDYTLPSPDVIRLGLALAAGVQVTIVHLGFGTVSRYAGVDGSVRTATLADGSVTAEKLADGSVTGRAIGTTAIVDAIGGTAIISEATGLQTIYNALSIEGQLRLVDGSGDVGQIVFPPSANPSIDANTLDDYQEGTYVPIIEFGGANQSLVAVSVGTHTKIGDLVHFQLTGSISNKGSSTGAMTVQAPYISVDDAVVNIITDGINGVVPFPIQAYVIGGTNEIALVKSDGAGSTTPVTDADVIGGTSSWKISGQFKAV